MCVCVCVHVYVHTCVCVHGHTHTICIYVCVCVHVCVCMCGGSSHFHLDSRQRNSSKWSKSCLYGSRWSKNGGLWMWATPSTSTPSVAGSRWWRFKATVPSLPCVSSLCRTHIRMLVSCPFLSTLTCNFYLMITDFFLQGGPLMRKLLNA